MTTYARIENGVAVEIFVPHNGFELADCFHPEVAALFVEVPDNVTPGSTVDASGKWTIAPPPAPPAPPPVKYELLTPMQFYLAFKPAERIAIKKCTDENVQEFWATFELAQQIGSHIDPNLTSVQQALQYLAIPTTATPPGPGILASADRIAQILNGMPQ